MIFNSRLNKSYRKVFWADGNAMVLSTEKLLKILTCIKTYFPKRTRVSSYAIPSDILSKSYKELALLREHGLKQLYIGIETGDDQILKFTNKGSSFSSILEALLKAQEAGIKLSVIILNGLGGKKYSYQHAINSARMVNLAQPEMLSTLILSFPFGKRRFIDQFGGHYVPMEATDLLEELEIFVENTYLKSTIFRSDHASNYLALKGVLSKDKQVLLEKIRFGLHNTDHADLRAEYERGL